MSETPSPIEPPLETQLSEEALSMINIAEEGATGKISPQYALSRLAGNTDETGQEKLTTTTAPELIQHESESTNPLETLTGAELDQYVVSQLMEAYRQIWAKHELGVTSSKKRRVYRGVDQSLVDGGLPIISSARDKKDQSIGQRVASFLAGKPLPVDWVSVLKYFASQHVADNHFYSPFISFSERKSGADDFGEVLVEALLPENMLIDVDLLADYGEIDLSKGGMSLNGTQGEAEMLYLGDTVEDYTSLRSTKNAQEKAAMLEIEPTVEANMEPPAASKEKATPAKLLLSKIRQVFSR